MWCFPRQQQQGQSAVRSTMVGLAATRTGSRAPLGSVTAWPKTGMFNSSPFYHPPAGYPISDKLFLCHSSCSLKFSSFPQSLPFGSQCDPKSGYFQSWHGGVCRIKRGNYRKGNLVFSIQMWTKGIRTNPDSPSIQWLPQ